MGETREDRVLARCFRERRISRSSTVAIFLRTLRGFATGRMINWRASEFGNWRRRCDEFCHATNYSGVLYISFQLWILQVDSTDTLSVKYGFYVPVFLQCMKFEDEGYK